MVHPMLIWGHEDLRFVSHCHECIAVFVPGILTPAYVAPVRQRSPASPTPPDVCRLILAKVTVWLLFLGGEIERGIIPKAELRE